MTVKELKRLLDTVEDEDATVQPDLDGDAPPIREEVDSEGFHYVFLSF